MTKSELLREFQVESGIDMTDHEYSGTFPRLKNGKWGTIARHQAWKIYANFLQNRILTKYRIND